MWTNDKYHIIALPNLDKSFTCNLFIPLEGQVSIESLKTKQDFENFIKIYFPTL